MNRKTLLNLAAAGTLALAAASAARAAIVINEVDSDTFNTPTTDYGEFIELYSTTGTATALDGLTLVLFNGSSSTTTADNVAYKAMDLDGLTTNANGYYVFGTSSVAVANDTTFLGATGNFLQNGQDAVALYTADATAFPNGTVPTTANLLDALVYGTEDPDDTVLLSQLGKTIQVNEGPNPSSDAANITLSRFPNATGQFTQGAPTPGAANIPEPATLSALSAAAAGLLLSRRRRHGWA